MDSIEKYIPGFEGRYVVSTLGYVRRCGRQKRNYGTINNRNDNIIHITDNSGRSRIFSMSRLVAEVFIPNPDKRTQVDHIDTNRRNNRVDNLRWVWPKENMANFKTTCHLLEKPLPFKTAGRKGCVAIFPNGEKVYKHTYTEMAAHLGCSPCTVARCATGSQGYYKGNIIIAPWNNELRQGQLI